MPATGCKLRPTVPVAPSLGLLALCLSRLLEQPTTAPVAAAAISASVPTLASNFMTINLQKLTYAARLVVRRCAPLFKVRAKPKGPSKSGLKSLTAQRFFVFLTRVAERAEFVGQFENRIVVFDFRTGAGNDQKRPAPIDASASRKRLLLPHKSP